MLLKTLRRIKRSILPPTAIGKVSHQCPTMRLGSEYGGWAFNPTLLDRGSVVYSAGIGDDISFDLELIDRFALDVHAFDPTPKSIEWLRQQALPAQLHVHEYGIAAAEGHVTFYRPENPAYISLSVVARAASTQEISLPVRDIPGIMRELGHRAIDLLKLDIEGSEYAVLEDLIARDVPVKQLLVEFHHRFPNIGNQKTETAIKLLEENGYRLFAISQSAEEYSFLKI